VQIVS